MKRNRPCYSKLVSWVWAATSRIYNGVCAKPCVLNSILDLTSVIWNYNALLPKKAVLLNIRKAYRNGRTARHLMKMKLAGCAELFIRGFLRYRNFPLHLGSLLSEERSQMVLLPQGCVLSPLILERGNIWSCPVPRGPLVKHWVYYICWQLVFVVSNLTEQKLQVKVIRGIISCE